MFKGFIISVFLLFFCTNAIGGSAATQDDLVELMSLEVETTSAMKRAKSTDDTPASIFVLERRDIEISGYTRLPELLKLLLGVDARRLDNNQWAVSVRSVASRFNSNLLVMIDGKTVSDPIINGISWEALNYPVDDIERIELVRGPSGILWGNSSNNGLLNIISRHTSDTQGMNVKISFGDTVEQVLDLRYGGVIDDISSYKIFGGLINGGVSNYKEENGQQVKPNDYAKGHHIGAQYDLQYADKSAFKAQILQRKNVTGLVEREIDPQKNQLIYKDIEGYSKNTSFNFRVDHSVNNQFKFYSQLNGNYIDWSVDNDLNEQTAIAFNFAANYKVKNHFLSFGGDIIKSKGNYSGNIFNAVLSSVNKGVFIQDELSFFDENLKLTFGNRWDYMPLFQRWENSPSVRFYYQFNSNHSVWGAYSEGYRMMINADKEQEFNALFPSSIDSIQLVLRTNTKEAIDYSTSSELGYRYKNSDFDINASIFNTDLEDIFISQLSFELVNDAPALISTLVNEGEANNYGLDIGGQWHITPNFNILLGYSYLSYKVSKLGPLEMAVSSGDYTNEQFYSRMQWSPIKNISIQLLAKHIGSHEAFTTTGYDMVDVAFNWYVNEKTKFTLVGQNLTNSAFVEFPIDSELFTASSALGRMINLNLTYQF